MLRPPTQQVALFSHKSQQKRGVVRLPFWALPPASFSASGCYLALAQPVAGCRAPVCSQRFGGAVQRSMWLFHDIAWHRPTGSKLAGTDVSV